MCAVWDVFSEYHVDKGGNGFCRPLTPDTMGRRRSCVFYGGSILSVYLGCPGCFAWLDTCRVKCFYW